VGHGSILQERCPSFDVEAASFRMKKPAEAGSFDQVMATAISACAGRR
jgi:hypothetical protein